MTDLTSHFYMFGHRDINHPRRIAEGYPDEGQGVRYTTDNRAAIISVINTTPALGIEPLFPILPELLAPQNGGLYHNTFFEGITDVRAMFIWEPLDILARMAHDNATHAIHFYIPTDAPFAAGHLAYTLLRLLDGATKDANANAAPPSPRRDVKMKDLVYSLTPSAIYGCAYFTGIDNTYSHARAFSTANPYYTFSTHNAELPITTWPEGESALAHEQNAQDCYENTRSLNRA